MMFKMFKRPSADMFKTRKERAAQFWYSLASILFCYRHTHNCRDTGTSVSPPGSNDDTPVWLNTLDVEALKSTVPLSEEDMDPSVIPPATVTTSKKARRKLRSPAEQEMKVFWDAYYILLAKVQALHAYKTKNGPGSAYWKAARDVNRELDDLCPLERKLRNRSGSGPTSLMCEAIKIPIEDTTP